MSAGRIPVSRASLGRIAELGLAVPTYAAEQLQPKIVHVGVGAFHRAHMALATHELADAGSDWGIRGLGLMPADVRMGEALRPQDHLYTLTEKASDRRDTKVIGSIVDYVFAAGDPAAAAAAIVDPGVRILSLTITESGYPEPEPGERVTADLLVECLDARRLANGTPITVLSCDNLPGNGDVSRRAFMNAATRRSNELAAWVEANCSFPNSMVDRIVPATVEADRQHLRDTYDIEDRWPVVCEPFRQWVIEDDFIAGRPDWEHAGALITDDVHSWELYKLRFLNAGHSAIAYLSSLAGIVHVDEAVANEAVSGYLRRLLCSEALPSLHEIPGHPREDYIGVVFGRLASTGVRDQIHRLCMDGTAKFPTFLIPTVEWNLAHDGSIAGSALALAGWARYLATTPVDQQAFDASGDAARAAAAGFLDDPLGFLDFERTFPAAVRDSDRFRSAFADAARQLTDAGPIRAMLAAS